jgi:hypothetical protein
MVLGTGFRIFIKLVRMMQKVIVNFVFPPMWNCFNSLEYFGTWACLNVYKDCSQNL